MSKSKKKIEVASLQKPFNTIYIKVFFVGLIIFLYGRTIGYEYTLDDSLFISNNPLVQKGFAGIGDSFTQGSTLHFKGGNFSIYRPIQISFFCIENQLFGFNASLFHFLNIVLYGFIALIFFSLLQRMFPKLSVFYSTLITILFIVHPIHTEVVANVKSQDELLATLFNLSALLFLIKSLNDKNKEIKYVSISLLFYLLALFSKESSFAFVAIFPIALFLLFNFSIIECIKKTFPYFIAALFFLLCRYLAIRNNNSEIETTVLENVLYGAKSISVTIGTKFEIAFYYLKMMVVPYPMSWDYSFNQIPLMSLNELIPIISILSYCVIAYLILANIKKRPEISFGLIFFITLIAPTANIFFLNGATFADRFLFLPSVGFLIAFVFLIIKYFRLDLSSISSSSKKYVYIFSGLIIIIFCSMTINRTADWENDFAVFQSGVAHSPNSSRTTAGLGSIYMNKAEASTDATSRSLFIDSSIYYFKRSLTIFPDNYNASYKLGLIYSILNNKDESILYYKQSIGSNPLNVQALNNLGAVFASSSKFDSAYNYFERSYKIDSTNEMTLTNICIAAYNNNQNDKSIFFGEKAVSLNMGNKKIYNILSLAWGKQGDLDKSKKYNLRAEMSNENK